jgi:hypothetical protein
VHDVMTDGPPAFVLPLFDPFDDELVDHATQVSVLL